MVWAVFEAFLNGILPHLLQGRPNRRSRNWAKSTKQVADLFSRETCGSVQNIGGPEVTCCIPVPRPMEDLVVLAVQLAHCQGGRGGDEAHHDPLHKDGHHGAWQKAEKGRQGCGLPHSLHFFQSQLRSPSPPPHLSGSE